MGTKTEAARHPKIPATVAYDPPPTPFLYLEVVRGRTDFPMRPVCCEQFLIGASEVCDLRLGGPNIPKHHSAIRCSSDGIVLKCFLGNPPLLVNGEPIESVELGEGDRIEIDTFQFVVRNLKEASDVMTNDAKQSRHASTRFELYESAAEEAASCSAAELVDLIEAEQQRILRYERARRQGADALLRAVRARAAGRKRLHANDSKPTLLPIDGGTSAGAGTRRTDGDGGSEDSRPLPLAGLDAEMTEQIVQLCHRLSVSAGRIQAHAQGTSAGETSVEATLAELVEAHRQLAARLKLVPAASKSRKTDRRRAIA